MSIKMNGWTFADDPFDIISRAALHLWWGYRLVFTHCTKADTHSSYCLVQSATTIGFQSSCAD